WCRTKTAPALLRPEGSIKGQAHERVTRPHRRDRGPRGLPGAPPDAPYAAPRVASPTSLAKRALLCQAEAHELPAQVRLEEVAIGVADVAPRRGARTPTQHHLV